MTKIFEPQAFLFEEKRKVDWLDDYGSSAHFATPMFLNVLGGLEALVPNLNYKSDASILKVFDHFGKDLVIDAKWVDKLVRYVFKFTTKRVGDTEYNDFFDSPYLGLHRVVFTSADKNEWFYNIFDVDDEELKENLHECKWVNKDWKVSGDVFNLTIVYLMYRVWNSDLIRTLKEEALINLIVMYHCKCITSMISNDYVYLARRDVVLETYNRLSLRYDIKRYGSWRALFEARAKFIIDPRTGIHFKTFTRMDNDKAIIYMVGDIQDRLRGVVNDINKVFHDVKNKTNIIKLDSATVNLEDGIGIRDVTKVVPMFKNYINEVLSTKTGFFKSELVEYACKPMDHSPIDKLERIIKLFPDYYNNPKLTEYKAFVEEVTTHMFEYLTQHKIILTDLLSVLEKMKGAYTSSRTVNESVFKMRELGDKMVKEITGIKTTSTVTSLRTSLMLYICLRMLTMERYK